MRDISAAVDAIPLGKIVRRVVAEYDADHSSYIELFADIFWTSITSYFLGSFEEAMEFCRNRSLLRHFPSRVWHREHACSYAEYLDLVVGNLRGENGPVIRTSLAFDDRRSDWLEYHELRDAVQNLRDCLDAAIAVFNINTVAVWFTGIMTHQMDWPEILAELSKRDVEEQASALDRLCYGAADGMLRVDCDRAFREVAALDGVPVNTRNIFLLTPAQFRVGGALRVGVREDEIDPSLASEVVLQEEEEPEPEPVFEEVRTEGGVYLPGTRVVTDVPILVY